MMLPHLQVTQPVLLLFDGRQITHPNHVHVIVMTLVTLDAFSLCIAIQVHVILKKQWRLLVL